MKIDWSKAPEGADKYNTSNEMFYRGVRPDLEVYLFGGWTSSELMPSNELFVYRPAQPWAGDGLPPVGSYVEYGERETGIYPVDTWREGDRLEVLAHRTVGDEVLAVLFNAARQTASCLMRSYYRPIKTPAQIAADEREAAIERILADYEYTVGPCTNKLIRSQAARIYDAGYRKTEGAI